MIVTQMGTCPCDISLYYKFEELIDIIIDDRKGNTDAHLFEKIVAINPSYLIAYIRFMNEHLLYDYKNNILLQANISMAEYIRISSSIDNDFANSLLDIYKEAFYYFSNTVFKKKLIIDSCKLCKVGQSELREGIYNFLNFYGVLFKFVTNNDIEKFLTINKELYCNDLGYTKRIGILIKKL
jgi:hypothetical protein